MHVVWYIHIILIMLFDQFYIDLIIAHRSCNNRGCCMMLLYMYAHRFSTSFGLLLTHQQLKLYSNKYIWKLDTHVSFDHTTPCWTGCVPASPHKQSSLWEWLIYIIHDLWLYKSTEIVIISMYRDVHVCSYRRQNRVAPVWFHSLVSSWSIDSPQLCN